LAHTPSFSASRGHPTPPPPPPEGMEVEAAEGSWCSAPPTLRAQSSS
jgi:hypothetical protein